MHFGDYDLTETVNIPFNTFTSNDPSESVTVTNLVAGDIEIHKDGSTTKRSSDAGVTVSIDFDGVTGNHMVHIDLSDNTDVGYYSVGARYQVRLEGITVDAGTLNVFIGTFSVGCVLRPTTDGAKLDVSATGEAGLDFDNIKDATGAHTLTNITVPTVTTNTDMVGTDNAALASVLGAAVGASISADIADIPTVAEFEARTIVSADYVVVGDTIAGVTLVTTCTTNTDLVSAADVVDEWESQSQADPTGFHVNLKEVAGTNQTAGDLAALLVDIPTVAEFEARTIVSADYVVVGDTIAGVTLVTTCTTNTDMVGTDNAALASVLGAAVGASISADIADLPTVAEFEARTIVSADYVVVGDTIAGVTLVTTCTTNTDLVSAADIVGTEVANDGTAISLAGALNLLLALETGKTSGGGTTTLTFRNIADDNDALVATVDGYGNRSAIGTRDAS